MTPVSKFGIGLLVAEGRLYFYEAAWHVSYSNHGSGRYGHSVEVIHSKDSDSL